MVEAMDDFLVARNELCHVKQVSIIKQPYNNLRIYTRTCMLGVLFKMKVATKSPYIINPLIAYTKFSPVFLID